jgi:hypothetical protein
MDKTSIRLLKAHYGTRWAAAKYNKRNTDKVLLIEDKVILSYLLPGKTLAFNCIGSIYNGIMPVDVSVQGTYTNLLLINNVEFKYKTPEELATIIKEYATSLENGGRILLNLNLMFIIYDRLNISIDTMLNGVISLLEGYTLFKKHVNIQRCTNGYGQIILILDKHE